MHHVLSPPRWLTEQPDYAVPLNPDHVKAGLSWATPGTRHFYSENSARAHLSLGGGPKFRHDQPGRAGVIGFGSTCGTEAGDYIRAFPAPDFGSEFTVIGVGYLNGQGGGSLGRWYQVGEAGVVEGLFMNGGGLSLLRDLSTTDGQWTSATAFPTGAWTQFDVDLDTSVAGTVPTMRFNRAAVSVTTNQASAGNYVAATGNFVNIGGRPDGIRGLDGMISWMSRYRKRLSIRQKDDLYANPWQQWKAPSRVFALGSVAGADTTAPTLTSPTSSATGSTTGTGGVTTDEGNGTLYAVCTTSATAPTGAQVRAGQDHTGASAPGGSGNQTVTSTGAKTFNATSLTPSTTYWFHFQHRDAAGNDSSVVSSASFTTSAAGDVTPPTLSSPTGTQTGSTTGTGGATTNEANGTMYVVASTSATAPSAAQVKAGLMHTGAAAAASGNVAISSTGAKSVNFTGLTPSTTYYAHTMHEDASANQSSVVSSASFTTAAASAPRASYFHTLIGRSCNV